ncbi:hypothetical protein [Paenibacillus sp. ov031]|nr:hypothetical protein [Paenibacillus sp. ov031]
MRKLYIYNQNAGILQLFILILPVLDRCIISSYFLIMEAFDGK